MQSILGQEASMCECGDRRMSEVQGDCAQRSVAPRNIARQPSYSVMLDAKKISMYYAIKSIQKREVGLFKVSHNVQYFLENDS